MRARGSVGVLLGRAACCYSRGLPAIRRKPGHRGTEPGRSRVPTAPPRAEPPRRPAPWPAGSGPRRWGSAGRQPAAVRGAEARPAGGRGAGRGAEARPAGSRELSAVLKRLGPLSGAPGRARRPRQDMAKRLRQGGSGAGLGGGRRRRKGLAAPGAEGGCCNPHPAHSRAGRPGVGAQVSGQFSAGDSAGLPGAGAGGRKMPGGRSFRARCGAGAGHPQLCALCSPPGSVLISGSARPEPGSPC